MIGYILNASCSYLNTEIINVMSYSMENGRTGYGRLVRRVHVGK